MTTTALSAMCTMKKSVASMTQNLNMSATNAATLLFESITPLAFSLKAQDFTRLVISCNQV